MNLDDPNPDRAEVHRGYDLEAGVLQRVRDWTDLFPWVRLGRTMRVAVSPPLLVVTAVSYAIWLIGGAAVFGIASPADLNQSGRALSLTAAWSCLAWAPAMLALTRQGGLLTAGRPMARQHEIGTLVWRRTFAAWLTVLVVTACVVALAVVPLMAAWPASLFSGVEVIEALFAVIIVAATLPCGILWFGSAFAIPLAWAALANERDPDALDALSRGYESLYRRPLQLAMYLLVAAVILLVVYIIAKGVCVAALQVAVVVTRISRNSPGLIQLTAQMLHHLPKIVCATQAGGLIGGIYLLLRYDTGGQEVEDIWQPDPRETTPLPDIPDQQPVD